MIDLHRKYKLHARQPLGISPPGIGPGTKTMRRTCNASHGGGRWHPAIAMPPDANLPDARKAALFRAWTASWGLTPLKPSG